MNNYTRPAINYWNELKTAPVTWVMVAANVVMFLWETAAGGSTNTQVLYELGARFGPAVLYEGQWWRLFTAAFLHIGWMHLLTNMVTLIIIGRITEILLGSLRYLLVYLASAISGNLFGLWLAPNTLAAGASGAIFGLFGVYLFLVFTAPSNPFLRSLANQFVMWMVLNIALSFVGSVDLAGHLGGALCGALLTGSLGAKNYSKIAWPLRLGCAAALLIFWGLCFSFAVNG